MYGAIAGIYDQDYYWTETQPGLRYRIILNDWEHDRRLELYDEDGQYMESTTTAASGRAELTFAATDEVHYLGVFKSNTASPEGTTVDYDLRIYQIQPTPTVTPQPTNTPAPGTATPLPTFRTGFDPYEPNYDFDTAKVIAPGVTYNLNFIPWTGEGPDNDFFKLWVKPGLYFTCETFDLDPGVDTNVIIYNSNRDQIAGNDDVTLGDYSSRVSFFSTYEGWLYILVGHGERIPLENTDESAYSLECTKSVPGQVTMTPRPGETTTPPPSKDYATPRPTATPREPTSPVPTPTPTPEGEGSVVLTFRVIATPAPLTPTPRPSGFRTFRLIIYYDANADGQFGAGEGVSGFFVRVLDPTAGEELARGYTDEQGQLSFSVPTVETVRMVVPLLGIDRFVDPSTPEVKVRIAPMPLPVIIP
jgi:hypothetical protein